MTQAYDIIVIGAGIAGASAACALSEDARVLLIEGEAHPGYHATGRSAAYFAPAYGNNTVKQLTAASEAFFRHPPENFSAAPLINSRPALFVGREDQADSMEAMRAENPSLRPIDIAGVTSRVPIINTDVIAGGLFDETGGDLEVDAILHGFLSAHRRQGGEILMSFSVNSLKHRDGLWIIDSPSGEITTPVIVNAAGAWADQLALSAGVGELGIIPKRRTAILIDAPANQDINDWPLVIDIDERFYFKPDAGQILVSPADETPSEPCDAAPHEMEVAVAIDRFMHATNLEVRKVNHRWAGLRTFAPDKTFVVGFDPRVEGFFWLAGQGGYGVQSAPAVAQLARHLLLQSDVSGPFRDITDTIDAVSPRRLVR